MNTNSKRNLVRTFYVGSNPAQYAPKRNRTVWHPWNKARNRRGAPIDLAAPSSILGQYVHTPKIDPISPAAVKMGSASIRVTNRVVIPVELAAVNVRATLEVWF